MNDRHPSLAGYVPGFIAGATVALGVELMTSMTLHGLFSIQGRPAPLQYWILLPLIAGLWGSRILPTLEEATGDHLIRNLREKFWAGHTLNRIVVVATPFWLIVVIAYTYLFDPFGHLWIREREYQILLASLFFPPAVVLSAYFVYVTLVPSNRE